MASQTTRVARIAGAVVSASLLAGVPSAVAAARPGAQPMTGSAVVAAAERMAGCTDCGSLASGARPSTGLATVQISDSGGGGFVMIMGYTGNRWGLLQAGQDSPYVEKLPGKLLICQAPGNRTNIRSRPSPSAKVLFKVSSPTRANATAFRLSSSGTVSSSGSDGEGWFKVRVGSRNGWVAAKLTYLPGADDGGCAAWLQWPWPNGSSKT